MKPLFEFIQRGIVPLEGTARMLMPALFPAFAVLYLAATAQAQTVFEQNANGQPFNYPGDPNGTGNFPNNNNWSQVQQLDLAGNVVAPSNWSVSTGVASGANVVVALPSTDDASYTISSLTILNGGVTINSGITLNVDGAVTNSGAFTINGNATMSSITNSGATVNAAYGGITRFNNTSTAGYTTITNYGGTVMGAGGGTTYFFNSSTVGNATITNYASTVFGAGSGSTLFYNTSTAGNGIFTNYGSNINFYNNSTAGNGTFNNGGEILSNSAGGFISFYDNSTAGNGSFINNAAAASGAYGGGMIFNNNSTAGNATFNNFGGIDFLGNSTAGNGSFINNSGTVNGAYGAELSFINNSSAGNATITNNGATVSGAFAGGNMFFTDYSTAANGTFINNGANLSGAYGGQVSFYDHATGGNGAFTNNAGAVSGALGGQVTFDATATAGNGTFINNGATLSGAYGGVTQFNPASTAGSATLIAYGGTGGGLGGQILFFGNSAGGPARVEVFGNGALDVSGLTGPSLTIGSIEGSGNVFLGANNLTVGGNNMSTTFSGVIQDGGQSGGTGGSLTLSGTGTLKLTGINTYSRGTTVGAGTLLANNAAGLATGGGMTTVNTGGTLGGNGTVAAVTLNGGGIIAPGAGSPGVAGTTLHAGSLLWNGGGALALQLGAGGDQLALNGALTKGSAGAYTLDISVGTVSQTVYTLATFSGTNFAAGDFALALPAGYSGILEETPTSLNLALDAVNSFVFSVGGTLTITNTLTLTSGYLASPGGTNTITGGSLLGPNGLHFDVEGNLIIGSTVIGNVVKTGGGSLFLDGALYGDFQLLQGLLGGTGSIIGNLFNGATVSPGDAPGTLRVSGNYTQAPGGLLQIRIGGPGATEHDLLTVGGVAQLAGQLQLARLNNFQLQRNAPVVFLTAAGGVSGQFSTVISDFTSDTILAPTVVYGSNSVELEAVQGSFATFAKQNGLPPNETAVAKALDRAAFDPRANKLIAYLDNRNLTNLPGDFVKISPDQLTSIFQIGTSFANVQSLNLQRRAEEIRSGSNGFSAASFAMNGDNASYSGGMAFAGPTGPVGLDDKESKAVYTPTVDTRWGAFLSGTGEWVKVGDTENARGYDLQTGGFTLGMDYKFTPNLAIGVSAGYAGTGVDLANNGRVFVNGGNFGIYGTYYTGEFYTDAAVNGGYNSYQTHRSALQGTARGNADGGELNALFGTGYDFKKGALTFGPTATFNYTNVRLNQFTESGSLAPLDIHGENGESLRSAVGVKASYEWKMGKVTIKPEVRAAWQHEFGDTTYSLDSSFANGAGNVFTTSGPKIGRDSLLVSPGFAVQFNERVSAYVYYDGELARTNYQSNSVTGGFSIAF